MAYMRFEGEAARRLWRNIKDDLDLLENALVLKHLSGPERAQAELQLITFLANAGFGEADVLAHRHTCRRELLDSNEPLTVEIVRGDESKRLELGCAIGYSAIIPLTENGYREYMTNQVSAFQFTERHIIRPEQVPAAPCYIYGEGVFHFQSLADPEQFPAHVYESHVQPKDRIYNHLFRHVKHFLPRLLLSDDEPRLQTESPGQMPIFVFADNGVMARSLMKFGFVPPSTFPDKGIAGYPRYLMDLADYNRADVDTERKHSMEKALHTFLLAAFHSQSPRLRPEQQRQEIGDYYVFKLLGRGGFSKVFKARRKDSDQLVALKVTESMRGPNEEAAVNRELDALQRLSRQGVSGVIQVITVERNEDQTILVLEYADGGNLSDYVNGKGGKIALTEAKQIIGPVVEALKTIHEHGIVHRDLKPENILCVNGHWKIADFGISKYLPREFTRHTMRGAYTPDYSAPEQQKGLEAAVTADIFSIGKIILFMLQGSPDREGINHLENSEIQKLIRVCINDDPSARPTIAEVREGINSLPLT